MWNVISSNKLLQQKMRQKNYQDHIEKLKNMKSIIRLKAPEQPEFVFLKPKLEMSRRDRLLQIDRENQILNNKMISIKNAFYMENKLKQESQQLKTLNQIVNFAQETDKYNENKRICSKLLRVGSHYPTYKVLEETQKMEKVKLNISYNARRSLSVKSLRNRPQSSTSVSSKFYRSRVSKYNNEGNIMGQSINILYKRSSESMLRPTSATATKKNRFLPQTVEKQNLQHSKLASNEDIKQFQTNIPSEQLNNEFNSPR